MRSVYLSKRQAVENEDFEDSDVQEFVCGIKKSDFVFEDLPHLISERDFVSLRHFLHQFKSRVDEVFMAMYETLNCRAPSSDELRLLVNLTFYADVAKYRPYLANFSDLAQSPEQLNQDDLDSLLLILANFLTSLKPTQEPAIDFQRVILTNLQFQDSKITIGRLSLLEQVLDCTIVRFEAFQPLFEQILAHAIQGFSTDSQASEAAGKPSKTVFSHFLYCASMFFFQKSDDSVIWFMRNVQDIYRVVCAFEQQRLHKEFLECLDGVANTFVAGELPYESLQLLVADTWVRYPKLAKNCIFVMGQLMEQESIFPYEDFLQMCLQALQSANVEVVSEAISFFTQLLDTFQMVDEAIIDCINAVKITTPKIAADLCEFWTLIYQIRPALFEKLSEELLECVSTMQFDRDDQNVVELFLADCDEFMGE